ncbi:GlxA family transcriptional regulator [Undibacterium sp. Di27W]|uniref:GlxA family transcriptional regulator n=1 Tax=Undibacterium sp. Di27W TaxID=3413036 RepID=UPI003BEFDE1E
MLPVRFDLLYLEGCLPGAMLTSVDAIVGANTFWSLRNPEKPGDPGKRFFPFRWRVIDRLGKTIHLPWLNNAALPYLDDSDEYLPAMQTVLVVPGLQVMNIYDLEKRIKTGEAEKNLIQARHQSGAIIAGSYNATGFLAEAGLLEHKQATMSWMMSGWLTDNYPNVLLNLRHEVVVDGNILTTGAPASNCRLIYEVMRLLSGDALANSAIDATYYQEERYKISADMNPVLSAKPRDGIVFKARAFLEADLGRSYNLQDVAQAAAVSPRTINRYFNEVLGMSPLSYLQKIRIQRAKQLLEISMLDINTIVEQCGYRDNSAFCRLFKRETKMSPLQFRRRYNFRVDKRWWRANDTTSYKKLRPEDPEPKKT